MTEKYGFELTRPGHRPDTPLAKDVTLEMIQGRHINDGPTLTGSITDVAQVPAIHRAIGKIVDTNNQIPKVMDVPPMAELRNDRLAGFIDPVVTADYDPYGGREPKRFLGIRKFVLSKTVQMAAKKEKTTENDMLTGFHLADTIQRAVASRPVYSSAGEKGRRGSIDTDSTSSVTEYRRKIGTRVNAAGEVEDVFVQPFKGTEGGIVVDADGTVKIIKNRGKEVEFAPSSRKQERLAKKLVKSRKKWRHTSHRAHDMHDTYPHESHDDMHHKSRGDQRAYKAGLKKAHHAEKHNDKRREKYVKIAQKPANEHRKATAKRMRRKAKLDTVTRAIAART